MPPPAATTAMPAASNPLVTKLAPSLVQVAFDMPFAISGITDRNYHGTGLLVDAERGLVVTDRNTVPVSLGDVRLTFGGALEIPGKVEFIHPLHNLAVVSYDPKLIGTTPVRSARLKPGVMRAGQNVTVIGMDSEGDLKSRATQVTSVDPVILPLTRTMQFRDSNLEAAQLLNPPTDFDGVLVDAAGRCAGPVVQLHGRGRPRDHAGFPRRQHRTGGRDDRAGAQQPAAAHAGCGNGGAAPDCRAPPRPFERVDPEAGTAQPGGAGVPWASRGSPVVPHHRNCCSRATCCWPSMGRRSPVSAMWSARWSTKTEVTATVWRGDGELAIKVPTTALNGRDIDRIVFWAGATLQAPHRPMSAQRGIVPVGVYVSFFGYGSPATRYRLLPGRRIVEVDGQPTPDLDAFLKVVAGRPDRSSVRLRTMTWNNVPEVITLKLDRHYWPTSEIVRTPDGWDRRALE